MQVQEAHRYARAFFTSANAGSYDSVSDYATFHQDRKWKGKIVDAIGTSEFVLELASGTGILTRMLSMARKKVVGLDLTFEYLAQARAKHELTAAQGTAELLPYRNAIFDAVVSSYLAKYVDIFAVVGECARVLRPGGVAVFHDFTRPPNRSMRMLWKIYFRILRLLGFAFPSWNDVFSHLDSVIERSLWEKHLLVALEQANFRNVSLRYVTAGTAAIVTAVKP